METPGSFSGITSSLGQRSQSTRRPTLAPIAAAGLTRTSAGAGAGAPERGAVGGGLKRHD